MLPKLDGTVNFTWFNQHPVKKHPYQPSKTQWAYHANFTHNLGPENLSRKNTFQGEDWIRSSWMTKVLLIMTILVSMMRTWMNRAQRKSWNNGLEHHHGNAGTGSTIRYTSGWFIPLLYWTYVTLGLMFKNSKRHLCRECGSQWKQYFAMLQLGDARPLKMSALCMLLELESSEDKSKAICQLHLIAFGDSNPDTAMWVQQVEV